MKTKNEIRKITMEERDNLSEEYVISASKIIKDKLVDSNILDNVKSVFIYCSFGNEVITYDIMKYLIDKGISICVPKVIDMTIAPTEIHRLIDLNSVGSFGIPEPEAGKAIEYSKIDLAIIPGVAFDKAGNRIGFGKGIYDRCLCRLRPDCMKLALAYKFQLLDVIPAEDHDIKIDKIFTD